jgi:Holliday junction resolvase
MSEASLQSKIVKYLKGKGCYVIKTRPGVGVPLGCPDLIFMLEGFWGAIEVKDKPTSSYKPLQEETLKKLNKWSWTRRIDNESWPDAKAELERML